ncbi:MAG TPA: hypothetical protein VIC05_07805 [Solirubrobacteraceae bacterium]
MNDQENIISEPGNVLAGPEPCMPCRGTGKVVSNQEESQRTVECPWCHGSGIRIPDVDAQATWLAADTGDLALDPAAQST